MVILPEWWKRWPTVAAPERRPAISKSTISSPSKATMPCKGRTQRRLSVEVEASPQRIDLGQGKARTIAGTASARTAAPPERGRENVYCPCFRSRRPSVLFHPALAGAFGEVADAADIGLAFGDGDDAASLEGVEDVARLDRLVVGGEREAGGEAAGV